MEALAFSAPSISIHTTPKKSHTTSPFSLNSQSCPKPCSYSTARLHRNTKKSSKHPFTAISPSSVSTESIEPHEPESEVEDQDDNFDWYAQWYPLMPTCDLDKRVPHAKRVMGIDVVLWWDRNENEWRVFDDACPHRLAPLSEGRIDQWGRLQCVYHGWCFNGTGDCKLIPQAPPDGPQVHTFKKACVAAYPTTVQHNVVWFWPNADPKYKDIIKQKRPPYIPELDDPSFTKPMGNRDIPYGYEVLIENLMDPAHVNYAHYGIMRGRENKEKVDREGGRPLEMKAQKLSYNGFTGKQEWGSSKFIAPCIFYAYADPVDNQVHGSVSSPEVKKESLKQATKRKMALIFICVPVSPGYSRLIWSFPRNFGVWIDQIIPRWMFHVGQNLILDSDLYLLHVEEHKIMDIGSSNWQKACFVPTKSDAFVVAFRRWLNKYAGSQVDWRGKYSGALPPTPPREQLMDRYRSHVVNCSSCNSAHKGLNALEVGLQIISVALIGIVAATKQNIISMATRTALVSMAILCFAISKWLSHFIYKNFHYHDYNHALR